MPFVRKLADKCQKGAAASVTLGLAFGYFSSIAPTIIVALVVFYGFSFLGFYGVALAILGFISTFPVQLALQTLSPISSNAHISSKIASLSEDEQ